MLSVESVYKLKCDLDASRAINRELVLSEEDWNDLVRDINRIADEREGQSKERWKNLRLLLGKDPGWWPIPHPRILPKDDFCVVYGIVIRRAKS